MDLDTKKLEQLPKHQRLRCATVDVTNEQQMTDAFASAVSASGLIATCVAAAGKDLSYLDHYGSLADMNIEQWAEVMRVNGQGTFLTARTWLRGVRQHATSESRNISLIVVGSEAGKMGVKK